MELCLRRSDGNAGHCRDLVMPVPFDVVENKHCPCLNGEGCNRRFEVENLLGRRGLAAAGIEIVDRIGELDPLCKALLHAEMVQHRVDGDTVKPCRERTVPAEACQHLPRLDDRYLCELLCLDGIGKHAKAGGIQMPGMFTVEQDKCRRVSRPCPLNQFEIAHIDNLVFVLHDQLRDDGLWDHVSSTKRTTLEAKRFE